MVCGVKTRALEYDPDRAVNFVQFLLAALGAGRQGGIRKFLLLVKLHPAIFATIGVKRHSLPSIQQLSLKREMELYQ